MNQLFMENQRSWDNQLVEQIFCLEKVALLLSILLSVRNVNDKLVWHWEKNGKFSIRSAYHIARKDCEIMRITMESLGAQDGDLVLWKRLWSACVPPKVKICVWRGCLDALPMRRKLKRRRIIDEEECLVCG